VNTKHAKKLQSALNVACVCAQASCQKTKNKLE